LGYANSSKQPSIPAMQVMILLKGIGVASRSVSLAEQAVFFGFHTVGGRNPAPPWMVETL
jgi:hypothetical protein